MKPSDRLQLVATCLLNWAKREERVNALFWLGSFARGVAHWQSDLDAAVVLTDGASLPEMAEAVVSCLGPAVRHCVGPLRGKLVLWCGEDLLKVEISLVRNPSELAWAAEARDVPPPRMVRAFARDGLTDAVVARAREECGLDLTARANEEIEKFLEGFEACSAAHRRSDAYSFYFEYNLTLHRVARLVQLSRGAPERLYLPPHLTNRCLVGQERKEFLELAAPMYLPEAQAAKRRLITRFLAVYDELARQHGLIRPRASIVAFAEAIMARDGVYNVRDVAFCMAPHVVPGRLFRSGKLSRWDGQVLTTWLDRHAIDTVIDLRAADEDDAQPPAAVADRIFIRAPIPQGKADIAPPQDPLAWGDQMYLWMTAYRESLALALRVIAQAKGAVVVHCHAGRDRTGCLVALAGMLLGVPREAIADDYEGSGEAANRAAVLRFMERVASHGGAEQFLASAGLAAADVARLREKLVPPVASAGHD